MASLTMGLGDALSPLQSVSKVFNVELLPVCFLSCLIASAIGPDWSELSYWRVSVDSAPLCSGSGSATEGSGHHVSCLRRLHLLRAGGGHHQTGLCSVWTNQKHRHVLGLCHHETQGHTSANSNFVKGLIPMNTLSALQQVLFTCWVEFSLFCSHWGNISFKSSTRNRSFLLRNLPEWKLLPSFLWIYFTCLGSKENLLN